MLAFAENFMNENSEEVSLLESSERVIRETNKLESATLCEIFSSG